MTGAKIADIELKLDVEIPFNYCDFHLETAEDGDLLLSHSKAGHSCYDYNHNSHMYCDSCGTNPKDLPNNLCVGCEAYKEHTQ